MRLLLKILILTFPSFLWSQQLHFKTFNVQNGLPQSQVYALENGANGVILIGTQGGGLAEYDGVKMNVITRNDGISSHYINDILFNDNETYLATAQGLSIKENGTWQSIDSLKDLSSLKIHDNVLWIGSTHGLYRYQNGTIEHVQSDISEIQCLESFQGDLWAGGPRGLYNVSKNQWHKEKIKEVSALTTYQNNFIIGTYGFGIFQIDSRLETKSLFPDIEVSIVTDLYADTSMLYIGTMENGAYVFKNDQLDQHFTAEAGLSNNHVRSFNIDLWGGLWIGTSGGGLQKFIGSQFKHMNRKNGINGDLVYSVFKDRDQILWVGTENGFQKLTDTGWVYFDETNQFSKTKVKSFFQDPDGTMWVGTDGKGMIRIAQDTLGQDSLIFYTNKDGLSSNWIRDIQYHPIEHRMYIATLGGGLSIGVKKKQDSTVQFQFTRLRDPNIPKRINQIVIDQNGRIWMASDQLGVSCWVNGIQDIIGNEALESTRIRALSIGGDKLWIGTATKGLYEAAIYSEYVQITASPINEQLHSNNIYQLKYTSDSTLWIGTEKGMDAIKNPNQKEFQVDHYGFNEGFTGLETCQNAIFEDSLGSVYIGTIAGLEIYSAQEIQVSEKAPILELQDILLFYQPISDRNQTQFEYYENHFGFSFTATFLPQPSSIEYQWRLKGYESDWSPWSEQKNINYSNLKPGQYEFEIRARSTLNQQVSEVKTYSFEIIPPFWQKNWFWYTVVISGVGIILIIVTLIILRIKRKNRIKLEQIELEKDLISLEQKALRLQMNPHFIFNALNSIQYIIGKEDPKVARIQLAKFSKLMRKILDNSRKNLITIEDELETIRDYIQMETFASSKKIALNIKLNEDIPEDVPIIPPLLLQPFVENAIIHGFDDSTESPAITIEFDMEQKNILICSVSDNGVGRQQAEKKKTAEEHKSTALEVTQERLDKINQNVSMQSLEIIDLKPHGTKVIFRLVVDIY